MPKLVETDQTGNSDTNQGFQQGTYAGMIQHSLSEASPSNVRAGEGHLIVKIEGIVCDRLLGFPKWRYGTVRIKPFPTQPPSAKRTHEPTT